MSNIAILPTRITVEAAWERYTELVAAANADKALWESLEHCQAMSRAHRLWQDLFLAMDKIA